MVFYLFLPWRFLLMNRELHVSYTITKEAPHCYGSITRKRIPGDEDASHLHDYKRK